MSFWKSIREKAGHHDRGARRQLNDLRVANLAERLYQAERQLAQLVLGCGPHAAP